MNKGSYAGRVITINTSHDKGGALEKEVSSVLHGRAQALLISPLILREMGCGQIDMALDHQTWLEVWEIKSSDSLNYYQKRRLMRSCEWLGQVLKKPIRFRYWVSDKEEGIEHLN